MLDIIAEYAPDLEQEIMDVKGIASRDSKAQGRKSPTQMKKTKSKPNESMMESFSKGNLSYTNESKGIKTMTENDVNMSIVSQSNNDKKKVDYSSGLLKESKHTSSNPNLNLAKQKNNILENGYQAQPTTYKEQNAGWDDSPSVRVMQFDFDDEESQNLRSGLSLMNYKSVPKPKEEKVDFTSLDGIQRIIEYIIVLF